MDPTFGVVDPDVTQHAQPVRVGDEFPVRGVARVEQCTRSGQLDRCLARRHFEHFDLHLEAAAREVHQRAVVRHAVLRAAVAERVHHAVDDGVRRRGHRQCLDVEAHDVERPLVDERDVSGIQVPRKQRVLMQHLDGPRFRLEIADLDPCIREVARVAREVQQGAVAGEDRRPAMRVYTGHLRGFDVEPRHRLGLAAVLRDPQDLVVCARSEVDVPVVGPTRPSRIDRDVGDGNRCAAVDGDLPQLVIGEEREPLLVR